MWMRPGKERMCEYNSGLNSVRYDVDSVRNGMAKFAEHWNNLPRWASLDLAKEYFWGHLAILIQFDRTSRTDVSKISEGPAAADKRTILHRQHRLTVGIENDEFGDFCGPNYGAQNCVLFRVIKEMQRIEDISLSRGKYLHRFQQVADRLTGCFYSITKGFKTDPIISSGQFEVAILSAFIDTDHLPDHVIESGPQIVDSVAYYQGEIIRGLLSEPDSNGQIPIIRIGLDTECVRICLDESSELPFKVSDVMIGPFDL
jgi:hypothetical protein